MPAIAQVGFPIVMCLLFFFYGIRALNNNTAAMHEIKDIVALCHKKTEGGLTVLKLIVMITISFVLMSGCAALFQDPELQGKLADLELKAAQAKAQAESALAEIKKNGLTPAAVQGLADALSLANQISQQINDIRNQSGGNVNWIYILVSLISGLTGYPVMRAVRLNFANSSVPPPKV